MAAAEVSQPKSAQDLLTEFVRDGRQQAFEEIVRRYAGMVFNTCLQVLRDTHDAEDATQAVFLTLAVQAKTANGVKYLAPWLQKVAQRLSLDVRRSKTRRKKREEKHGEMRRQAQGRLNGGPSRRGTNGNGNGNGHTHVNGGGNGNGNGNGHSGLGLFQSDDPTRQMDLEELKLILRDELDKLPAKYRLPLILHYFGGLRPEEMSRELGCKPSTLGVRLHRGRKLLAESLTSRGLAVDGALLTVLLAAAVQTTIAESLVHSTCRAAASFTTGQAASAAASSTISAQVLSLHQIAASGLAWSRLKTAIAAGVLAVGAVAGASELALRNNGLLRNLNLHFNGEWNLRTLIDPLFRSLTNPLRTQNTNDATPPDVPANGGSTFVSLPPPIDQRIHDIYDFGSATTTPYAPPVHQTYAAATPGHPAAHPPATAQPRDTSPAAAANAIDLQLLPPVSSKTQRSAMASTLAAPATLVAAPSASQQQSTGSRGAATVVAAAGAGAADIASQLAAGRSVVTDRLTLGGASGVSENFALNRPVTLSATNGVAVGDRGSGSVSQSDGALRASVLSLGGKPGGAGFYDLTGFGSIESHLTKIGDAGFGKLTQSGQALIQSDAIALGNTPTGVGVLEIDGGVIRSPSLYVGKSGSGTVNQFAGSVNVGADVMQLMSVPPTGNPTKKSGAASSADTTTASADAAAKSPALAPVDLSEFNDPGLHLAQDTGSTGVFNQHGGTVNADNETIAINGVGTYKQTGGTNTVSSIILAPGKDASAVYDLKRGSLQIQKAPADSAKADAARFVVGAKSDATLKLGSASATGTIKEVGDGKSTNVLIRASGKAHGAVSGWGTIDVQGELTNNGVVIADGYGRPHTLDLSHVSSVTNTIDNSLTGTNGWYARRGGKLLLPTIDVAPGTHTYAWGETQADTTPDLINSVRLTFNDVRGPGGGFALALIDRDRSDVPTPPHGREIIGLWRADVDTVTASSIDLLIRYDHALADDLMAPDAAGVELWSYNHHHWTEAGLDAFSWNPGDRTIAGTIADAPIFAVMASPISPDFASSSAPIIPHDVGSVVPEPSMIGMLALGAGSLLMRRRRRA